MSNKIDTRQYALVALGTLKAADAGASATIAIPMGALVTSVAALVAVAFDGTSPTLTVSDGTTTFVSAADVSAAGAATVTGTPKFYPTGGTITLSLAGTDVTAGELHVCVTYVVAGRANENQD